MFKAQFWQDAQTDFSIKEVCMLLPLCICVLRLILSVNRNTRLFDLLKA